VVPRRSVVETAGVNLAGYFTTESGVGEGVRLMARALSTTSMPHVFINFEKSYNLRRGDRTFDNFATQNPFAINLIHVNADQVPVFAETYGKDFFAGRYNIGFWLWELPDFPGDWSDRFGYFDEIWTPSAFGAEAIARVSPIPTVKMPLPVLGREGDGFGRSHYGLPDDKFVFLFMFDFMSVFERKNPLAVIQAFNQAFRPGDNVMLVLKCSNAEADPQNASRLREAARHDSIRLIEGYLSREEIASLTRACDTYVSLHRSEGFGLTMAEAMSLGKPVVATAYSANMDFMTVSNSLPVRYRLVELEKDEGPYRKGSHWADPHIGHAAELMRWIFEHREAAAQIGQQAREDIARLLSPEAVGKLVRIRLQTVIDGTRIK